MAANVRALRGMAAPAALCAVVKADGYGHGAEAVARAALGAGASWLAVAMAGEATPLRAAGIDAPVLVLAEPSPGEFDDVVALDLRPTVYTPEGIEGLARAVARAGAPPLAVHLKVDTGMHRVGAAPADALALASQVAERPELVLEGLWTHCAVADVPAHPFTALQAERFRLVVEELAAAGMRPPLLHAANSAATLDRPELRHDLVRCGITIYGLDPSPALHGRLPLRPALRLAARISLVRIVVAGEGISYGLVHRCARDSVIATVPLGYADGVARRFSEVGGEVLVGGERRPVAGTVTMDQLLVDCGPLDDSGAGAVRPGDEVVLIGEQGDECIGAGEWAERLGTIPYEVVCAISPRVPRHYADAQPAPGP
ncbi:MAG: alanine racemase [Actinomycetota bacterium]|nr:alanine racemase [Actinomycetota bacterium]